jgi:hypothetical protein
MEDLRSAAAGKQHDDLEEPVPGASVAARVN